MRSRDRTRILALLTLVACQTPPAVTRTDVQAYILHSRSWATVEADTARTIDRILATQFVDEAEIHRQIADSRPRLLAHLNRLAAYEPRSDEVRRVHRDYIATWDTLVAAYGDIEQGFARSDHLLLARGREGLMRWKEGIVGVAGELRQLLQHHGLTAGDIVESRVGSERSPETPKAHCAWHSGPSKNRSGDVLLSHTATV